MDVIGDAELQPALAFYAWPNLFDGISLISLFPVLVFADLDNTGTQSVIDAIPTVWESTLFGKHFCPCFTQWWFTGEVGVIWTDM